MSARRTIADFEANYIPEPKQRLLAVDCIKPNNRYGAMEWHGVRYLAHVLSYKLYRGRVRPGKRIDHLCRNTFCVNPDHLDLVTQRVNMERSAPATKAHCIHGHPYADGWEQYEHPTTRQRYRRCLTCFRLKYPGTKK